MRRHFYWVVVTVIVTCLTATGQSGSKTLGVVNGEMISEEQVTKAAAKDLENLEMRRMQAEANQRREHQEALEKALNSLVEEKLLSTEAAKRKMSQQELLAAEVDSKVKPPSDAEIDKFWEENKARIPISREQALPQIGPYLMDQQRNSLREAMFARLRKEHSVKSYLEPLRVNVTTAGHPSHGPASAPVTIVEFSDFQCPFCGNLFPVLQQVEKNYSEKVRIVYRQFPLASIHPEAQKASEASLCANDQNHFWEYHDSLFNDQQRLDIESLRSRAAELKLDMAAFNSCLDSGKHVEAIRQDIVEGTKAGVSGTPTMYVNGRQYRGDLSFAGVSKLIDDELERKADAK